MRLKAIIILLGCLRISGIAFSQHISLSEKNTPLEKVLRHIEQQTGYVFFFDYAWLQRSRPVTLQLKNIPLNTALDSCFKGQPLIYSIVGKNIVLRPKTDTASKKDGSLANPPDRPIHGHVTDSLGAPLTGASVSLKDSPITTLTDEAGNFTLQTLTGTVSIVVSYIGYETREILILDRQTRLPDITLYRSINHLDQVQVIAYGNTTRRYSTGDITTINASEISLSPVNNVLQAIQGRVPGLNITRQTGMPNGAFTVEIRSRTTFNQQQPLYVVDGVTYPADALLPMATDPGNINHLRGGNALNYLDPSMIENINVLKGPDATSIYGSRGAYGVIIITTKKGRTGSPRLTIDTWSGISTANIMARLLNTPQYLQLRREAFKNDGVLPGPDDLDVNGAWDTTRYTNWQKLLQGHHAFTTRTSANYAGGTETTGFLIGASYYAQQNVERNKGGIHNETLHINLNHHSRDRKFSAQLTGLYAVNTDNMLPADFSPTGNYKTSGATLFAPNAPSFFLEDGSLDWSLENNPASLVNLIYDNHTHNFLVGGGLQYSPLKGLSVNFNGGYSNLSAKDFWAQPNSTFNPAVNYSSQTYSTRNAYNTRTYTLDPNISYKMQAGRKGTLDLTTGATLQERMTLRHGITGTGYESDDLIYDPSNAAPTLQSKYYTPVYTRYLGFFGVIHYNWAGKYMLNLNGRRDGSSRFGPDKQFGNFGSAGAAWILSEEPWFKTLRAHINFTKLRMSYGTQGGDRIPDYRYLTGFQPYAASYQGNPGLSPIIPGNPTLQWESNRNTEIGLDMQFLKGRIEAEATWYSTRTSNQLVNQPLTLVTGFQYTAFNTPALIRTHGWEIQLTAQPIRKKNFDWTTTLTITIPRNKLEAYPNIDLLPNVTYAIGKPITGAKLFNYAGVDPSIGKYTYINAAGQKGTFNYLPGMPTLNEFTDRTRFVDLAPRYYGGLENTVRMGRISLDLLITFTGQNGMSFMGQQVFTPGFRNINTSALALDRWQKPGDRAATPAATQSIRGLVDQSIFIQSSGAYTNADYLRLTNLNIAYRFTDPFLQKAHITSFSVYLAGQNLLTFTRYKDLDPENMGRGSIGPLRTYTGGLNITF